MPQTFTQNRRIVLAQRPRGTPRASDFRSEVVAIPKVEHGHALLRTLYLSLDPYVHSRIAAAVSYVPPLALGAVLAGATVSRVEESRLSTLQVGSLVVSANGWQDYLLSDGQNLRPLCPQINHPARALGVLGPPGFAAYIGLRDIGHPKSGETIVVGAASGPVGSVVGQLAKLSGCHVVGLAGRDETCRYVVEELGFDDCVDCEARTFRTQLAAACPRGIDVYFESVGGEVFDAVWPLLNLDARVPMCGLIAQYPATEQPPGPDRLSQLLAGIVHKRITLQGFQTPDDSASLWDEFEGVMQRHVLEGKVRVREQLFIGLENAPEAFIGLLEGRHFGKLVVQLADQ